MIAPTQQQPDGEGAGLVERLRANADPRCHQHVPSLSEEAATHIEALTRRLAQAEADRDAALRECTRLATEAGEAQGRLEMSEAAGIVDGWREKCEGLERALAEAQQQASSELTDEWRTIETAPQEELFRCLATNGLWLDIVCFVPRKERDGREGQGWYAHHGDVTPTHWMPLPLMPRRAAFYEIKW